MTEPLDDARGELLACPLCQSAGHTLLLGFYYTDDPDKKDPIKRGAVLCPTCNCRAPLTSWNTRPAPVPQCEAEPKALPSSTGQPARAMTHPVPEGAAEEAPPAIQRWDAVNAGLRQREALAITRLRAAVSGEEFEWEVNGGSPFDDAKFLVDAYDRALVALWKIAGLIDSEDGEPLDDAIRIARAILSPDPGTVAVASAIPHRQFMARARPKQRGPVRCLYPDCEATFKDEWACTQHRIAVHNEGTPISSTDRGGAA